MINRETSECCAHDRLKKCPFGSNCLDSDVKDPVIECPATHPYAYLGGNYCCSSDKENISSSDGDKCDGSSIDIGSACCRGNHIGCTGRICTNSVAIDPAREVLVWHGEDDVAESSVGSVHSSDPSMWKMEHMFDDDPMTVWHSEGCNKNSNNCIVTVNFKVICIE